MTTTWMQRTIMEGEHSSGAQPFSAVVFEMPLCVVSVHVARSREVGTRATLSSRLGARRILQITLQMRRGR